MENMELKDFVKCNDNCKFNMKGHVIFRDPLTGEKVYEKDNLIVLRSRSYILELLFGETVSSSTGYSNNKNRKVCLFKIGEGGADINTAPFETFAPKFSAEDLNKPIPFMIEDQTKDLDPEKAANPSVVKELTAEQKKKYYLPKTFPDGSVRYYGKVFEEDSNRLKVNKNTGEVYMHLTLKISPEESRGMIYNELGLVLAEYDEENDEYKDPELFSMLTLDSDALKSLKRGVMIDYLIYA